MKKLPKRPRTFGRTLAPITIILFILLLPIMLIVHVLYIYSTLMNEMYDEIAFNMLFHRRVDALLDAIHKEE